MTPADQSAHRGIVNLDAWPVHVQRWVDRRIRDLGIESVPSGAGRFEHLSADLLADALDGFALQLLDHRNMEWLAGALQRVLGLATPFSVAIDDCAQSSAATRSRLLAAAPHLEKAAQALGDLTGPDLHPVVEAMSKGPMGVFPFDRMRAELEYVADCFRIAARHLRVLSGPHRAAAARELSIRRAYYAAPLFTLAYGAKATANDYPGANAGPWQDWFSRIIFAATGDRVNDLRKVLKEARTRHIAQKTAPLTYCEDWLAT